MTPEIANILFIDTVGCSKHLASAQSMMAADLTAIVSECPTYQSAKAVGRVMPLPTGDGMVRP